MTHETPPEAIGHVAPDFDDRRHFNTLRIQPQVRISLRLGSIDELCPSPTSTDAGRQMRLQLLGYLYEPLLNNPKLAAAHAKVWQWFTAELGKCDADLDAELPQIVEGGELPAPGAFARIFLPGSYCYPAEDMWQALGGPAIMRPQHSLKYQREEAVFRDNSVLGALPIIARVERFRPGTGDWEPAPDAMVYLQLQMPDTLSGTALAPPARATASVTPPAPSAVPGPAGYVASHVENPDNVRPVVPGDPQVDNCHNVTGGRRGVAVANNVLELTLSDGSLRPGFYAAHRERALAGRPPFFLPPEAAPAAGTQHRHAIRARTNVRGEAGFIFKPSSTGGDRYKLRAYVGDPTLPSDGTDPKAVFVETGTLVVWRRIRIARYLVWDYPAGFVQPPEPPSQRRTPQQERDFRIRAMGEIDFARVAAEYNKAYCDVIIERTAARRVLTSDEWTAARTYAIRQILRMGVNLQVLFPATNTSPA